MVFDPYAFMAQLQGFGFYDLVLPFLLIFTLTYAALSSTKVLGTKANNLNVIVSLILAFLFLQNQFLVMSLQSFLPQVSFAIILILVFLLLAGTILGKQFQFAEGLAKWLAPLLALGIIIWSLLSHPELGAGGFADIFYFFLGPDVLPLVLFVAIVIGVIFFVHKSGSGTSGTPPGGS